LQSLGLNAKLIVYKESNQARAVQLCQKTNQFNLTTRRHVVESLNSLASTNPKYCSLANLQDRYGDHGLVGLFCLDPLNDDDLYVDTFLLSCRVLGRQFEFWMMSKIIDIAIEHQFIRLIADYIPTEKNQVSEKFLEDCNFQILDSPDKGRFGMSSDQVLSKITYERNLAKLTKFDESLYEN